MKCKSTAGREMWVWHGLSRFSMGNKHCLELKLNKCVMKKIGVNFVLMLATFCYANVYAQKPAVVLSNDPGWQHIGQTTASFKTQDESIEVLGADEFSAIKLKVLEAPLHIERLQVFYESGDMEEIKVDDEIGRDNETRVIELKHPDRDIDKVAFTYKTGENAKGEKADVALYGLKTDQPSGSDSYDDDKDEIKRDARDARDDVREEANEAADDVETGAQSLGDKVNEGVNDAAAAIKDQKVDGKVGPGGETVYLNEEAKYYYVNDQGKKVFISKIELKDKPKDK